MGKGVCVCVWGGGGGGCIAFSSTAMSFWVKMKQFVKTETIIQRLWLPADVTFAEVAYDCKEITESV